MQRLLKLMAIFVVLVLLVSCTSQAPTVAPAKPTTAAGAAAATKAPEPAKPAAAMPKRGGTLRLSQAFDYPSMDPQVASTAPMCHHLMFNSLLWYSANEQTGKWEIQPELAESWDVTDPLAIVFHLRKGVKFQDGTEFNADVAKWNLNRMATNEKSFLKPQVQGIKSVDVIDPYTIRANLAAPSMVQLVQLTGQGQFPAMLSKSAVEKLGDDEFGRRPVGSGPMQFVEWLPSDHVTVKKADGYWDKGADGQPLPYLDGVVCRFKPDPTVALLDLKGGELDLVSGIEPKDVAGVKSDPNLVYFELMGNEPKSIGVNSSSGPFANNIKLRQAAAYGIDRESMAKTVLYGTGGAVYYYWVKGQPGYDETLPRWDYQPEKAKQLVKDAGFPNGIDVTLSFIARPMDQRIAEMAQAMLGPLGIRLKLDALERMAWISQTKAKDYQMSTWIFSLRPDPGLLIESLGCDAPINWSGHCNKNFDACMAQGDQTFDWNQRNEIYKRCQQILYEDAVQALTFDQRWIGAHTKSVKGMKDMWFRPDVRSVWLDK